MRHRYDESPSGAREESLRRVSRLTWRSSQLGVLATVGLAVLFARTAPAPAASVQPAPKPTLSAVPTGPAYPTVAATRATVKPRVKTSTRSAKTAPTRQAAAPAAAPPTEQAPPAAPATSPALAPPTTAPAPAPPSSAPPTVSSGSSGGN